MNKNVDVVITNALRTPIGSFNGIFKTTPATELGSEVIKQLINQSQIPANAISEVIMGQVLTANCGQNPARQAAIAAGIPIETPAYTLNQVCGSGLQTIRLAYQSIRENPDEIIIAGGQENMSLSPHAANMRNGQKMGNLSLTDTMITDGLWDIFNDYHMGITAENIAEQFNISREEQDTLAFNSQQKAKQAIQDGVFSSEIVPITYRDKKEEKTATTDEFPKPDTTLESLNSLRSAFKKDGTVTAGNASGINDGAAAVLIMSRENAEKYNLTPLATIKSVAQAGVDPQIMGTGPVPASKKALAQANWTTDDLDLIEANEAFAAQASYVNKELGLDIKKVNINGGAIALGHPIGASGTRIVVTLLHSMKRNNASKGLATLCIGGGMGVAICLENEL